jgi:hypothetical protein
MANLPRSNRKTAGIHALLQPRETALGINYQTPGEVLVIPSY